MLFKHMFYLTNKIPEIAKTKNKCNIEEVCCMFLKIEQHEQSSRLAKGMTKQLRL